MSNASCWPKSDEWQTFNQSINGRLITAQPTSFFCSGNPPDLAVCSMALNQWTNASWRGDLAGAMQNFNWENSTCTEVGDNVTCTQGSVPRLAVDATTPAHVQETIRFVRKHNLRLVMKTTGHDYLGRSTAADALLLWLHHMKSIEVIEGYSSCDGTSYDKPVRVAAGVQWGEVYAWLARYNRIAIGGASATVGAAGGYLQGGGHGPLTRWKGLAADQILEFEVVTADGERRRVNACENQDLFWALRGGGAGTYAAVLSVTLRTYPSPSMTSALYLVYASTEARYARFIHDFVQYLPTLADAGWAGYFYLTDRNLSIAFFAPNGNFTQDQEVIDRLIRNNSDLEFTRSLVLPFPSFFAFFDAILKESNPTGGNVLLGSRLIPEQLVRDKPSHVAEAFLRARGLSDYQSVLIGHMVAGGRAASTSIDNSVNPVWRQALLHMVYAQGWSQEATSDELDLAKVRLRTTVNILETITGNVSSASYMNEADPNEPNWQEKFFGSQAIYDRLKSIKRNVDPDGLFVCSNCVGSDEWSDDLNCPRFASTALRLFWNPSLFYLMSLLTHRFKF